MTELPEYMEFDERIGQAVKLLPAWFIPRMMSDSWSFGLVCTGGLVLGIKTILAVHQDAHNKFWLDVELISYWESKQFEFAVVGAPTSRTTASVAVDHVIYALELADT